MIRAYWLTSEKCKFDEAYIEDLLNYWREKI